MGDSSSPTTEEYAVRIPASFVPVMQESFITQPTPSRNLHNDFLDIGEEMQVYVRIKPCQDKNNILTISGNHVIVQPPKDSVSFKNRSNAGTKTLQKFKFNKIYDSTVNQEELFKDSALHLVQEFLWGSNTLLFTYGATSAGKTHTMLGSVRDAGLIPRSLDVVFNSLDGNLIKTPLLKPLALTEVMRLTPSQIEAEDTERLLLMKGFDLESSDTKDSLSSVTSGSIRDWNIRARDTTVCQLQHPQNYFSIWVSYCEIYNEQVFDLLDGCDKKKKRIPLRITEDVKGSKASKFYVKGLKEICVTSADDAVRVMLYGKENLHFAATKLNHNSSRSHCLFTVKMIRTNDCKEPTEACMSVMSFVDLAGMERTAKTESRGERLKEAGNINTSLMILGRCIDAMRSKHQSSRNTINIPYRESKLTRILQYFFSGQGRAAMYVNVSPSAVLCDETLHVLKFGALAQEVIIQPDRDASMADASISQFAPPLRPSRFQQYVRKSISLLSARASVLEPSFSMICEEDDRNGRIIELEEELARMKTEWEENEQKVREECCTEWTEICTRIDEKWRQRYEDQQARYEEFCENRVNNVSQFMNKCAKRKRQVTDEENSGNVALKFKYNEDRVEMLEQSNSHLTEVIEKLKSSLKISEESRTDLQKEMTRLQFEIAASSKPKMNFCRLESEDEHGEEVAGNTLAQLQTKLAAKEEMLNEAVLEYHLKSEEMEKITLENEQLKLQVAQSHVEISNLQTQLEKSNLLLSDANERLDVREEELVNFEEKLNAANGKFGNINTELRETKRKVRDLESRLKEQTNASIVSSMCEELQKQLLEAESELHKRDEEIALLKKNSNYARNQTKENDELSEELEDLRDKFTKSQIQLGLVEKELASFKEANEDLKARRESLLDQISHLKKDFEICNTERKDGEGSQFKLIDENQKLLKAIEVAHETQAKLSSENSEFRKAMTEYESTIEELTVQMGVLKESQRDNCLLEEELKTLVATLSRVQLEKNQLEKDFINQKTDLEADLQLRQQEVKILKEENADLLNQSEAIKRSEVELKEELKKIQDGFKLSTALTGYSGVEIASLKAELLEAKEKLLAMETLVEEKCRIEEHFQSKFDQLEKENETLNKDVLKHMRRANELGETIHTLKEELRTKSHKCELLEARIVELETQSSSLSDVHSQLLEIQKENAIKEKENTATKAVLEELGKKEALIEQIKEQNDRILREKNQEINRLQSELKSSLTGFVDYKKPIIKVEDHAENEQSRDNDSALMATPTPARTRRGRAKKLSPSENAQKELELDDNKSDASSLCGSTRSRRTIKADPAAPLSSTKTPARKPRKNKSDCEEVAHPALTVTSSEDTDPTLASDASTVGINSKRRLYNAKCPDILLPSAKVEFEGLEFPKRMATRSRKQ